MTDNPSNRLSADILAKKLKESYRAKKRNDVIVGTGEDVPLPSYWVDAPAPINRLLTRPGYGGSRIYQIAGRPNSGKTTLAMLAMIEAQKKGCYVILVDTEKKFSMERYEKMGGNPGEINAVFPTNLEEAFVGIDEYVNIIFSHDPDAKIFIAFDSLGGTPSQAESEADMDEKTQLATAAKVIARWLRVFVQKLYNSNVTLLFINQTYAKIGGHGYGNKGGDAAEYFSSVIIQLARVSDYVRIVKGERIKDGIVVKARMTKNHLRSGLEPESVQFRVRSYHIEDLTKGLKRGGEDEKTDSGGSSPQEE